MGLQAPLSRVARSGWGLASRCGGRGRLAGVPGAIAIVVVLLVFPVLVCMGGAALAAILGIVLNHDAEVRAEGSELLDLNV